MLQRRNKMIEFDSIRANTYLVERFVEEVCDMYNIFNSYFGTIILAVTEAVDNAILHGNQNDPSRKVRLEFESADAGLLFRISDQGDGFDPSLVSDPTVDDNDTAGRGIYLMRSLSDSLNFSDGGKTVELGFEIASINRETTLHRRNSLLRYMNGEMIQLNDDLSYGNEKG